MTVTIHSSNKFHYAREQYYAVAHGHTLLRLTYGSFQGNPGGTIKTATASDYGAEPVFRDHQKVIASMRRGVQNLGGNARDVTVEIDDQGRRFGEITLPGTRDRLRGALYLLAEQMDPLLARSAESLHSGCPDLCELYHQLYVVEGEPIYLSDGLYLDADGHVFE